MVLQGSQLLAYEWALFAITTAFVFARLYVRVYRWGSDPIYSRYSWRWSDIFILITWLLRVSVMVADCFLTDYNTYNMDFTVETAPDQAIARNKLNYFEFFPYVLEFVFVKFSMLCMFAEFVPKVLVKTWVFIRVIAAIVALHGLANIILLLVWCRPISSYWDKPEPTCGISVVGLEVWFSGHIATDLLIITIPFCVLHLMQNLSRSQKAMSAAMFSLGFITITCAFANAVFGIGAYFRTRYPTVDQIVAWNIVSMLEPPTAICVACVPPLRLLFTSSGRRKLRDDQIVSVNSRRASTKNTGGSDWSGDTADLEACTSTTEGKRLSKISEKDGSTLEDR